MILLDVLDRARLSDPWTESVDAVVVAFAAGAVHDSSGALPPAIRDAARSHLEQFAPSDDAGQVHELFLPGSTPARVLLAGIGDGSATAARIAGVAVGRRLAADRSATAAVLVDVPDAAASRALAEGLVLGGYQFSLRSDADEPLCQVALLGDVDGDAVAAGDEAADAAAWARDLGNTPAGVLDPARMGELAVDQLTAAGCTVQVRDEAWLAGASFGGVLAVGGGAAGGPRLIEASWRPRAPRGKKLAHVVLVGKGITFDSGGLNLKPPASMRTMYTDMCGGAAVLGAIHYAAMRALPVRVTVLVPAAENAVGSGSMRPSDIITHANGRTTEIGNTDAEGRLVLADALAYAVARLRPDVVIDLATLTGAMVVALGTETAGYFANDDELAGALEAAAAVSGEPVWRMPLEHRYVSSLDSAYADARNDPGSPGAITAALFLQPFVGDVPWAHVDIAGPSHASARGPLVDVGATGFGTRLLASYLDALAVPTG